MRVAVNVEQLLQPAPGGIGRYTAQLVELLPTRARGVDVMCAANPPIQETPSDWKSVGFDANSTRFQKNPGLKAAAVPKLKVKWAFAMTGGGAPTVVGDWLFVTNRSISASPRRRATRSGGRC